MAQVKQVKQTYIVTVNFFNEVDQGYDIIEYVIQAKNYAEAERKAIKETGDSLVRIENIQLSEMVSI